MNILLINHYAGSPRHGMEYRPYYLAREWVRAGHAVTIVAASTSHVRTQAPAIMGDYTEEVLDGIRYVWLRTPDYAGNGPRRVLNIAAFLRQLARYKGQITAPAQPHAVIASSTYPLDMAPARRIARKAGARLIFEVHDLWPLSPIELGGMSPRHPFIVWMQWGENFAYRHCDRVVSMLPKAEEHMRAHGLAPGKFVYIPNGIDVAEWRAFCAPLPPEHAACLESLRAEGRFLVGYAGAHGLANALHTILEAAAQMRDQPVTFVMVGQGPEKEALQARAAQEGLTNVVFLPTVPKNAIPALLDQMDALYIGLKRVSIFRFGISPNKLMDYMMAAKPILLAIEAGNDLVAESGCGISILPEDAGAITQAVLQLRSRTQAEREAMGACGKAYVLRYHDYTALATQFLEAIG